MSTITPRQPFGLLNDARLQALTSIKNRQNNILASPSSLKSTPSSGPTKRRLASVLLSDDSDEENKDPTLLSAKRHKGLDSTTKVSKFALAPDTILNSNSNSTPLKSAAFTFTCTQTLPAAVPAPASVPASVPSATVTATLTPLANSVTPAPVPFTPANTPTVSRISKHFREPQTKSNKAAPISRRVSSSPISKACRFSTLSSGPGLPSSSHRKLKGASLPFSIDAALQGTLTSYTPSLLSKVTNACSTTTTPSPPKAKGNARNYLSASVPSLNFTPTKSNSIQGRNKLSKKQKPAPDSWFFDIHEDTPEQEATNFLLHNASVLDISSDDDATSARVKDAIARGKENVPPPNHVASLATSSIAVAAQVVALSSVEATDMWQDRRPLGEIDVRKFWAKGAEEEEHVVVDDDDDEEEEEEDEQHDKLESSLVQVTDISKEIPEVLNAVVEKQAVVLEEQTLTTAIQVVEETGFAICEDETAN